MEKSANRVKKTEKWATTKWFFTAIPLLFLSYIIGYVVIWFLWQNVWISSIAGWVICYFVNKKYGIISGK